MCADRKINHNVLTPNFRVVPLSNKNEIYLSGMLSAALESYFKAEVPDIMMIPVSISYDRIVEESLYAFELLGVPKPKESASVSRGNSFVFTLSFVRLC